MPRAKTETQTSCDLRNRNAIGDVKRNFVQNKYKKCRGPRARHRLFVRACAVENAIGNVTRATLCENLQIECRGPRARHRLCSSLRNRNAFRKCGNVTRAALCRRAKPATQTLRGPAQSKCTWKCHKSHFVRKFTGKMPSTGLYSSRKNPSV